MFPSLAFPKVISPELLEHFHLYLPHSNCYVEDSFHLLVIHRWVVKHFDNSTMFDFERFVLCVGKHSSVHLLTCSSLTPSALTHSVSVPLITRVITFSWAFTSLAWLSICLFGYNFIYNVIDWLPTILRKNLFNVQFLCIYFPFLLSVTRCESLCNAWSIVCNSNENNL